ncbi:MAG TPA: hypothetical protein VME44_01570 [Streptosporangiaceae bacterium]|nr:hypothetical protein [Streptosporangiaceae bacterium]
MSATVTRLLVDLLAEATDRHGLTQLILSGGGSSNPTTAQWLRATGARHAAILGSIQPGAGPLMIPEPATAPPRHLSIRQD